MTTLTVNIPESAAERIEKYIHRMGGQVIKTTGSKKLLPIEELENALCEVKEIRVGKIKKQSLKEALRG